MHQPPKSYGIGWKHVHPGLCNHFQSIWTRSSDQAYATVGVRFGQPTNLADSETRPTQAKSTAHGVWASISRPTAHIFWQCERLDLKKVVLLVRVLLAEVTNPSGSVHRDAEPSTPCLGSQPGQWQKQKMKPWEKTTDCARSMFSEDMNVIHMRESSLNKQAKSITDPILLGWRPSLLDRR